MLPIKLIRLWFPELNDIQRNLLYEIIINIAQEDNKEDRIRQVLDMFEI